LKAPEIGYRIDACRRDAGSLHQEEEQQIAIRTIRQRPISVLMRGP
jgi:hypothetical protein